MFRLFRHRHRFCILVPNVARDPILGILVPLSDLYCRCGAKDPWTEQFKKAAGFL
jgi:hypothetical protein